MQSRHEIWLNGLPLSTINEKIRIEDISYSLGRINTDTFRRGNYDGSILTNAIYETSAVTVTFYVLEYSVYARTEIMQAIAKWAMKGGKLSCSDRPLQHIYVRLDSPPVIASAQKWTQKCTMTFRAYGMPFWQSDDYDQVRISGTDVTKILPDLGAIDGFPEVRLVVSSGTLTNLQINCGLTVFKFTGLSLGAGKEFIITHDPDTWLLKITADGTSAYANRTEDSSDELRTMAGENNTIRIQANTSVSGDVTVRRLNV